MHNFCFKKVFYSADTLSQMNHATLKVNDKEIRAAVEEERAKQFNDLFIFSCFFVGLNFLQQLGTHFIFQTSEAFYLMHSVFQVLLSVVWFICKKWCKGQSPKQILVFYIYYVIADVLAYTDNLPGHLNPCDKVSIVQSLNLTVIVSMVFNLLDWKSGLYFFLPVIIVASTIISTV